MTTDQAERPSPGLTRATPVPRPPRDSPRQRRRRWALGSTATVLAAAALAYPLLTGQPAIAVKWPYPSGVPSVPCESYIATNADFHDIVYGFDYQTDDAGRPVHAVNASPLRYVGSSFDRTGCSGTVGRFTGELDGTPVGGPNPSESWDGGHLVGAAVQGVDTRYNMVPQLRKTLNRRPGVWFQFETLARTCLQDGATIPPDGYDITVNYPPANAPGTTQNSVFPESFTVHLRIDHAGTQTVLDKTIPWYPDDSEKAALYAAYNKTSEDAKCTYRYEPKN
ncbi:DNA/RNA non-specific endonuclease [Kitasatospora sp. NPDC002551]|uniref:DNA/RNA non-specific endonuclease n=1 Tax=unclassified Kitasatospora TaxID=2633591 RepID=UPI003326423A